jgi:hypothetical protein
MKIEEGSIKLEVAGVTNLDLIKQNLSTTLEKYRNILWTEETRKDIQEVIKELKPERTKIKKVAAAFNKEGKAAVKRIYDQIKEVEAILDDVINPLEQGEKDYLEKCRIGRLEKKQLQFKEKVEVINILIDQHNKEIKYLNIENIKFLEEWGNLAVKTIDFNLDELAVKADKTRQNALDRIDLVNTHCELLKSQYDLATAPNGILILDKNIYTMNNQDIKERLDDFAANQQATELEAAELAEQEALRKSEVEKQKLIDEQKEKEREAELQKQKELLEAQEKARQEERDKIAAEKAEEEERKKIIKENDKKLSANLKTKDYTMFFPQLTTAKAKKMQQFFIENKIKFETTK